MKNNYIKLENINSSLVEVSEEISNKNIDNFITTFFKNSGATYFNKSQIFYSYLDLSNEYQILNYTSSNINITQIELLSEIIEDNFFNLVIFENYFLLFKGKRFYFLQNIINELKDEDLVLYIKKRFNFNIEKKYILTNKDLPKDINLRRNELQYIKNNKSLNIFYLYSLLLLCVFLFSNFYINYYRSTEYQKNLAKMKLDIKYNNTYILKNQVYEKIVVLLNELLQDNIYIHKVDFNKNKINLTLSALNKYDLYKFFKKHKNIKINYLKYIENKREYETNTILLF